MADGTISRAEVRPLPSIEEFARFLYEKGGDISEVRHAVHRLLQQYAGIWAGIEGQPNYLAQQKADELFRSTFLTADEQQAEADFSKDDGE